MCFQGEGKNPLENTSLYQRAESEDSDADGGLGNVNKLIMRPPGHSGKAKKGHICFDASFETGNLGRVDLISEFEYDLFIRPDTCSPRLRFWFNFTVDNVRSDQRVIFNLVNISKTMNLFRNGMTPLVKSSSRSKWQRIPRSQVYYYRSPQHQNHYVLSFAFAFDREEDVYQFALTYPYSYSRYVGHLDNLCTRLMFTRRELLATSIQKRKVDLITISSDLDNQDRPRRVVAILCRIHPGESPSSYICQGLMDFLVSSHPIARTLRDYIIFKIVPMLNPDGVFLGNHRSTLMGADLNRCWNRISHWIHPVLTATKTFLETLDKNTTTPLDCVIDFHAHTNATGLFVYGNTYDDVYRYERHIVLPKLLAQHADDYQASNTMYNQDFRKAGTTRRFLCSSLKEHVNCYTLQVSIYGYCKKGIPEILPYTEEGYYRIGRNLARVFLEYYKLTGLIPLGLPDQPSKKSARRSRRRYRVYQEPRTRNAGRTLVPLHLTSIHEVFREEIDCLLSTRKRSSSSGARMDQVNLGTDKEPSKKIGIKGKHEKLSSEILTKKLPNEKIEPMLTIIDFNQLTKGGLDLATKKNQTKLIRRNNDGSRK